MASIRQRNGKWQARVIRDGFPPQTKTFIAKSEAEKWARGVESQIDKGAFVSVAPAMRTTLGDIIRRYLKEVTPGMKSAAEDTIRLSALSRKKISLYSLANLSPSLLSQFRDERLQVVQPGTVIRELAYLSSIINHARREWGINIPNPVVLVRKPPCPPGRSRILSDSELDKLMVALEPCGRRSAWIKPIVVLALETAMRRGELLALKWENIDLSQRTAKLLTTKNGDSRVVPLSTKAIEVLNRLPRDSNAHVFPIKALTLFAAFKRAVKRAGLDDLRFHDLRHMAVSRMADRLPNIIELSAVSGHKSLVMLKRYYHPNPAELAKKLG